MGIVCYKATRKNVEKHSFRLKTRSFIKSTSCNEISGVLLTLIDTLQALAIARSFHPVSSRERKPVSMSHSTASKATSYDELKQRKSRFKFSPKINDVSVYNRQENRAAKSTCRKTKNEQRRRKAKSLIGIVFLIHF